MSIDKDAAPTHRSDHDEGHGPDANQRGDPDAGPGRALSRARILVGIVVLALAAAWTTAYVPGPDGNASASGTPLDPQIEALASIGISPEQAGRAIAVQSEVASTQLANKIIDALGDSYAGVWFQPAQAKFYIGVTSAAARNKAERVLAESQIAAGSVVILQVRSTWGELIAAQEKWNARLAKLLAGSQARTGILTQYNAVAIDLSSSIPSAERAALESEATAGNVNVQIGVLPPSQLSVQDNANCTTKFVKANAFCERTIVAGVGIGQTSRAECSAGPMLVSGTETFMLTAGHCFGTSSPMGGYSTTIAVKSEYPSGGGLREIGNGVTWVKKTERDMAIVKVKDTGSFGAGLPTPVPAVMAEWGLANAGTPHAVNGQENPESVMSGQTVCHEGVVGGEKCGVIKALNRTSGSRTEHLVETTACGEGGDSGGPYFFRTGTGEILILGIEIASVGGRCNEAAPRNTLFEPLIGLSGLTQFGILGTFTGKSLLTAANQRRGVLFDSTNGESTSGTAKTGKIIITDEGATVECESATGTWKLPTTESSETVNIHINASTGKPAGWTGCKASLGAAEISECELQEKIKGEETAALGKVIKSCVITATECTVTILPEAANENLKEIANKNLEEESLLSKLHIMGLTTEAKGAPCTLGGIKSLKNKIGEVKGEATLVGVQQG